MNFQTNEVFNKFAAVITANKETMQTSQTTMNENEVLASIANMEDGAEKYAAIAEFVKQVRAANDITNSPDITYNTDAKKIDGCDAEITLNGIQYTGSTNNFSVNGLNITAQVVLVMEMRMRSALQQPPIHRVSTIRLKTSYPSTTA